jgi:TRAP-type C4-dicarboxylate transport system permease small subunit
VHQAGTGFGYVGVAARPEARPHRQVDSSPPALVGQQHPRLGGAMTAEPRPGAEDIPPGSNADRLAEQVDEASRRLELGDPDRGLPRVDRIVNKTVEVMGVAVLSTIVAVIFINAVGRYAFNVSLIWAEELVLLLVPWLAMTGLFLAVRRGTMIRIEYFFNKFYPATQRRLASAGYLACVAVLLFIGWVSTNYVLLFGFDRTAYLNAPKGASTGALAIGGFAAAIAFLVALCRERKRARQVPSDEP